MFRIAWLTDIHLNFVEDEVIHAFLMRVKATDADAILLGGDIGEAHTIVRYLELLDDFWQTPMYLVLGNHDFYQGGIGEVRSRVARLCDDRPFLHYLSESAPVTLTEHVGLVGHDGWADAREGDYHRSLVMMNDYLLIDELARYSKRERLQELFRLGDEAAAHLRPRLDQALQHHREVLILTHVPPWRAACWYQGRVSDDEWAPHFVCQAMGRAILDQAARYPDRELTVLCGHTHSAGECRPVPNVKVITGGAEYRHPAIARTFDLATPGDDRSHYEDPA